MNRWYGAAWVVLGLLVGVWLLYLGNGTPAGWIWEPPLFWGLALAEVVCLVRAWITMRKDRS